MRISKIIFFALFSATCTFTACSGSAKEKQEQQTISHDQYKCPMNCTDELYEKPGNCPHCGMELEKVIQG